MLTGTISELDTEGLFGVIDAEDGHLVLFNLNGIESARRREFTVGMQVEFVELTESIAPRAVELSPVGAHD